MKQEILDRLNEIIVEEKGTPVTINSKFKDANLDSLGTILTIATLETEYPFFGDNVLEEDVFKTLDVENLTIRELIRKCVLSITTQFTEQSKKTDS